MGPKDRMRDSICQWGRVQRLGDGEHESVKGCQNCSGVGNEVDGCTTTGGQENELYVYSGVVGGGGTVKVGELMVKVGRAKTGYENGCVAEKLKVDGE